MTNYYIPSHVTVEMTHYYIPFHVTVDMTHYYIPSHATVKMTHYYIPSHVTVQVLQVLYSYSVQVLVWLSSLQFLIEMPCNIYRIPVCRADTFHR
jgi:hypothetical protein